MMMPTKEREIVADMKAELNILEQRMKDDELHLRFLTIRNRKDKENHARLVLRIQSAENSDGTI